MDDHVDQFIRQGILTYYHGALTTMEQFRVMLGQKLKNVLTDRTNSGRWGPFVPTANTTWAFPSPKKDGTEVSATIGGMLANHATTLNLCVCWGFEASPIFAVYLSRDDTGRSIQLRPPQEANIGALKNASRWFHYLRPLPEFDIPGDFNRLIDSAFGSLPDANR